MHVRTSGGAATGGSDGLPSEAASWWPRKMQMVSLKFGMFRELAKTTEEQAKKDLHRIRSKHLCKLFSDLWKCMYM